MKYISKSNRDTQNIARIILKDHMDTNLFVLMGPIGSGKTEFVKGFSKELGILKGVTSPTFTIKSEYEGISHYDIYNASKNDSNSITRMIEEDIEAGKKVIVEWGEKFSSLSQFDPLYIKIEITGEEDRTIEIK